MFGSKVIKQSTQPRHTEGVATAFFQPKLTINEPNDSYEQEADATADHVMRMPVPIAPPPINPFKAAVINRKCADCEDKEQIQKKGMAEEEGKVQKKGMSEEGEPLQMKQLASFGRTEGGLMRKPINLSPPSISTMSFPMINRQCTACEEMGKVQKKDMGEEEEAIQKKGIGKEEEGAIQKKGTEEEEPLQMKPLMRKGEGGDFKASLQLVKQLEQSKGNGTKLTDKTRHFMESRFQRDFTDVRIHENSQAAEMSQSIRAKAFTTGRDIYFNQGQYQPNTEGGRWLLAHELTHTVQQGAGVKRKEAPALVGNEAAVCAGVEAKAEEVIGPDVATTIPNNTKGQKATTQAEAKPAATPPPDATQSPQTDTAATPTASKQAVAVSNPAEDAAFQNLTHDTKKAKTSQNQHDISENIAQEAQANAKNPAEKESQMADANKILATDEKIAEAPAFDKETFKANVKKLIAEGLPADEGANKEFKQNQGIDTLTQKGGQAAAQSQEPAKGVLNSTGTQQASANSSPVKLYEKEVVETPAEEVGKKAAVGQSERAIPKPVPQEAVQLDEAHNADSLDKAMEDENLKQFDTKMTNEQLSSSNEPEFQETLATKQEAQTQLCTIPTQNRTAEANARRAESVEAQGALDKTMAGKFAKREKSIGEVNDSKDKARQNDEAMLASYYSCISCIYEATKKEVDEKLSTLDSRVSEIFEAAMTKANDTFKSRVKDRLDDYYGEGITDLSDEDEDAYERDFNGQIRMQIIRLTVERTQYLPDSAEYKQIDRKIKVLKSQHLEEITERIFREEKATFIATLDTALDEIGTLIETTFTGAKASILKGREDIKAASEKVPTHLQEEAKEKTDEFTGKFDDLDNALVEKQKEIEDSLAKEYVKNVSKLKETFEKIREESAMPWWKKAWNAIKKIAMIIYDIGKLLLKILIKAVSVIGDIVAHPIRFIGNLIDAIGSGFSRFVDNIAEHLERIIFKLILGNIPPNVKLPQSWDPKGLFTFALDFIGLNKENIREKAVLKLGEPVVNALEDTFDLFVIFKKEGFAGLWEHIKDKIGDLKEMVIGQVKKYMAESIIKAAVKFLLSALTPASGFIKACETIINVAKFFLENLKNLLLLLESILDSFIDIAQNKLESASKRVENALADILLIGIKFLAALVGIKFDVISAKITKLFNAIRNPVNRAINWLLDKAKAFAQKTGLLGLAKKGKEAVKKGKENLKKGAQKAVSHLMKWLNLKKEFTAENGESHKLYFVGKTENAVLTLASDTPGAYEKWIKAIKVDSKKEAKKTKAIAVAQEIDVLKKKKTKTDKDEEDKAAALRGKMDELSKLTGPLFSAIPDCSVEGNGLVFGKLKNSYGSSMKAEQLTKKNMPDGTVPGVSGNQSFNIINQRRNKAGSYYVLGHLLNHNLGGTGREWKNLTPLTRNANKAHEQIAEANVKKAVKAGNIVSYQVTPEYGRSKKSSKDATINEIMAEEANVPLSLTCSADMINPTTNEKTPLVPKGTTIDNDIEQTDDAYDLVGVKRTNIYLSEKNAAEIATIDGVDKRLAEKIVAAHVDKGSNFNSYDALADYESDSIKFTDKQKAVIRKLKEDKYYYVKLN